MKAPRSSELGPPRLQAFAGAAPDLEARARRWFEAGPGPGDVVIKPERVWRCGSLAVKRFPAQLSVRLGLRRSGARLNAALHYALAPVRTPTPWMILEARNGESLLVCEFIEGRFLGAMWNEGGPGVEAFPHFMAAMHTRGIFHGDFHLFNALWDGRDWVLLDLEGLRHALRRMRRRSLILDHWGRVHFSLRGARGLKDCFATYAKAAGLGWEVERVWPRIVALSAAMALERGVDPAYTLRDGLDPVPAYMQKAPDAPQAWSAPALKLGEGP